MKTRKNNIVRALCLVIILLAAVTVRAQTTSVGQTADNDDVRNSFDRSRVENGKRVEQVQMYIHDQQYKIELVDDKMTKLFVNGKEIPAGSWDEYSGTITAIREQIKENRLQAARNEEQAKRNQLQAQKNEEQAVRNQEQQVRNQEQVEKNRAQEKLNETQAQRNEEQAVRNQEQQVRNQEQAEKNQEQAVRNELQAKKNQEQAEANERFIKSITADLVADKIIRDENSLNDLTLNGDEMIVNGVKQPAETHKKYIEKYSRFSGSSFSFSNHGIVEGH